MDWRHAGELLEAAERQHLELKNLCVWVKTNAGMGSFYRSRHELVFVFKHGQAPHQNHFQLGQHGRTRTNIWEYAGVNSFGKERDGLLAAHPTPKPVAMIADALRDVSKRGEYVVDPFLGSGSTLMAAEATGRICVGNELDGAYVDVAIRRWQKATGKAAIHVQTGRSFDATAQAIAETTLIEALASNNTMTPPIATGVAGMAKGEPPETAALTVTGSTTHLADTLASSSSDLIPDQPAAFSMPLIGAAAPDGDLDVVEEAGDDIQVRHD
jgi:hypothetical protein